MLLDRIKESLPVATEGIKKKIIMGISIGVIGIVTISPAMANVTPTLNEDNNYSISTYYNDYANEESKQMMTEFINDMGKEGEISLREKFGCPVGSLLKEIGTQRYVDFGISMLDREAPDFVSEADLLTTNAKYMKKGQCEIVKSEEDFVHDNESKIEYEPLIDRPEVMTNLRESSLNITESIRKTLKI